MKHSDKKQTVQTKQPSTEPIDEKKPVRTFAQKISYDDQSESRSNPKTNNRKAPAKLPIPAKVILTDVMTAWNDRLAPGEPLDRISDDTATFRKGIVSVVNDCPDGKRRVVIDVFLDCEPQTLLLIGKALKDFVPLTRRIPTFLNNETKEFFTGKSAQIEYGKRFILNVPTPDQAVKLFRVEMMQ